MRLERWPLGAITSLWLVASGITFATVLFIRAHEPLAFLDDPRTKALTDTAAYARLAPAQRAAVDSFRQSFARGIGRSDSMAGRREDLYVVVPAPQWEAVHYSALQGVAPFAPVVGALIVTLMWHRRRQPGDAGV